MWFLIAWLCVGYLAIALVIYDIGVLHLDEAPLVVLAGLFGPITALYAIAWFTDEHRVIWRRKQ